MASVLLALEGISKRFGKLQALSGVTFHIGPSEVIALLGSNGAGKSTLMSIASGLLQPDKGELLVDSLPTQLSTPRDAIKLGIRLVPQEPELFDDLSILENASLSLQLAPFRRIRPIRSLLGDVFPQLLRDIDPTINLRAKIRTLTLAQRQVLVLLNAIIAKPRLLFLDEPTASLSERESLPVVSAVKRAIANGTSVIFATHRIDLVAALARRALILRDGLLVDDVTVTDENASRVLALITPRLSHAFPSPGPPLSQQVVEVGPQAMGSHKTSSFVVHLGESLGLTGGPLWQLSGLLRKLSGISTAERHKDSASSPYSSPKEAIAAGIAYVTSDRRHEGIFPDLPIAENLLMALLVQRGSWSFVSRCRLTDQVRAMAGALPFSSSDLWKSAAVLSGGNQQKVILLRLLALKPRVLVLDNSTRGLDTAGRVDLANALMAHCAARGSCLVSASEVEYLRAVTHRIINVYSGAPESIDD